MGIFNALANVFAAVDQVGLIAIGAGLAIMGAGASSIGEGMICAKAIEGMTRNPEMQSKLRSTMIFVPAGMPHNPMRILEVNRPIFHFSVVTESEYNGSAYQK